MNRLQALELENDLLRHKLALADSAWRMTFAGHGGTALRLRVEHILDLNELARCPDTRTYTWAMLEEHAFGFSQFIDRRVRVHGLRGIEDDSEYMAFQLVDVDFSRPPPPPQKIVLRSACGGTQPYSVSSFASPPKEIRVPIIRRPNPVKWSDTEPLILNTEIRTFEYGGQDHKDTMAMRYDEVVP